MGVVVLLLPFIILNLTILKIVLKVIDKVAVKHYNNSIKSNEGQIGRVKDFSQIDLQTLA